MVNERGPCNFSTDRSKALPLLQSNFLFAQYQYTRGITVLCMAPVIRYANASSL